MKKIFTFLFFATVVTAASAQNRHAQYRDQNNNSSQQPGYAGSGHQPGNGYQQNNGYHQNEQTYGHDNAQQGYGYNNGRDNARDGDNGNERRFEDRHFNDEHRGFERMEYDRYHRYPNRAWFKFRSRYHGWD